MELRRHLCVASVCVSLTFRYQTPITRSYPYDYIITPSLHVRSSGPKYSTCKWPPHTPCELKPFDKYKKPNFFINKRPSSLPPFSNGSRLLPKPDPMTLQASKLSPSSDKPTWQSCQCGSPPPWPVVMASFWLSGPTSFSLSSINSGYSRQIPVDFSSLFIPHFPSSEALKKFPQKILLPLSTLFPLTKKKERLHKQLHRYI